MGDVLLFKLIIKLIFDFYWLSIWINMNWMPFSYSQSTTHRLWESLQENRCQWQSVFTVVIIWIINGVLACSGLYRSANGVCLFLKPLRYFSRLKPQWATWRLFFLGSLFLVVCLPPLSVRGGVFFTTRWERPFRWMLSESATSSTYQHQTRERLKSAAQKRNIGEDC